MIYLLKLIERLPLVILSLTLLFLMHLSIPNMGGTVAHPREYLVWIGLFTLVLLSVICAFNNKTFILPSYLKYFIVYTVLILSTSIFNPVKNWDIFNINALRLIAAFIIWLSLHQFRFGRKEKESLFLIILASSVIESIFVILKFYATSHHIHSFGVNFATSMASATKYIPVIGGAFQQKNLFASWTATGIAISLYFITTERFSRYKNIKRSLIFISLFLLSAGLVLASSRAGLIGAALAITVLFATNSGKYAAIKRHLAVWILVFAVGIGGGFYLSSINGGKPGLIKSTGTEAKEKLTWLSDTKQRSFAERLIMYDTSYEMFKEKPVFGQGFSNFGSTFMHHKAKISKAKPRYKDMAYHEFISHPHNELLYILAECGIVGMLAVVIALLGIGRILFRTGINNAGISIALLMPLTVHMMFEYPLKLSTAHTFLFIIIIYSITSQNAREVVLKRMNKKLIPVFFMITLFLYAGITGYTLKTFYDYMSYNHYKLLYGKTGIISEKDIVPAVNNIYLRNWAEPDHMYRKALKASLNPQINMDFINKFLLWNEKEKDRRPALPSYHLEGLIFYNLGKHNPGDALTYFNKARSTLEEGLSLYPNDRSLISLRKAVIESAIGNYLTKPG